jgi:hypothetical protein
MLVPAQFLQLENDSLAEIAQDNGSLLRWPDQFLRRLQQVPARLLSNSKIRNQQRRAQSLNLLQGLRDKVRRRNAVAPAGTVHEVRLGIPESR